MAKKGLKKELGIFSLVALGVGGMIGSGIFVLPATMAAYAGPGLILGIFLSGLIALVLGIAYAELGAAFPITGGPYSLPRLALGNFAGFFMGWGYFLYLFIGTAGVINIFVVYLGFYFPALVAGSSLSTLGVLLSVVFLWILTLINIYGVKWGGYYAEITTIGKLIPLLIFVLAGLAFFQGKNFIPFLPYGLTGIPIAISLFFWSYTGFEAIVVPSEEVKNPSKTIPWSMILTILISIAIYTLIAAVFVGMIDWQSLNFKAADWTTVAKMSSPFSEIPAALKLPILAATMVIGAIIATGGASGSWVLIQGRMPFAMARDKLFWNKMGNVHKKFGTPTASLVLSSLLSTVILLTITNFPAIALMAVVTVIPPYAAAMIALLVLRKSKKNTKRPFRLPYARLIALLGFILATYLMYWAAWPWTMVGILLMLTGYPAFLLVKKHKFEIRRNLWILIYLIGVLAMSMVGDKRFISSNFTDFEPLNIIPMPWDLLVLAIFAIFIFEWAYLVNKNYPATAFQQAKIPD